MLKILMLFLFSTCCLSQSIELVNDCAYQRCEFEIMNGCDSTVRKITVSMSRSVTIDVKPDCWYSAKAQLVNKCGDPVKAKTIVPLAKRTIKSSQKNSEIRQRVNEREIKMFVKKNAKWRFANFECIDPCDYGY